MKRKSAGRGRPLQHPDSDGPGDERLTARSLSVALLAGPAALVAVAAAMAWWTWGTWADVLVDFGQQLYLPWQITQGRALYADLAYYNGPLSQYVNALAFRWFGVGLQTLVVLNLCWMGLLVGLLHHACRRVGGRVSAAAACLVFLLLFGFAHYVGISNYNYVCPYSHEMTHGLILSLAAMVCVWYGSRFGPGMSAAGGMLLGLAFLTKAEVFVAGAAGTLSVLILTPLARPSQGRQTLKRAGGFLAGLLVPPLIAFLLLCLRMPPRLAFTGTMGSWVAVANKELAGLEFFQRGMGLTDIRGNLLLMAAWAGGYAVAILAVASMSLAARKSARRQALWAGVTVIALAGGLWVFWRKIAWGNAARGLPLALLFIGAILTVQFFRTRGDPGARERKVRQISLTVFALAMLGKMALNARIYHYGFVLAMPATLLLVVALMDWIPAAVERRGGSSLVFRAGAFVLLGGLVFAYLGIQGRVMSRQDRWVTGPAGDRLRADAVRGGIVDKVLEVFPRRIQAGETLAALPEGVMLNFLLRRPNPTPFTNFMPTEMILFGETKILAAFREHPPDWIALVHKDTSEFGFRFFGQNYGRKLFAWIMAAYRPVGVVGAIPLRDNRQGILLMRRKGRHDG